MPVSVALKHVESLPTGWIAQGQVTHCPMCAAAARAIRQEIPILASEFRCPTCDKLEKLDYRISRVSETKDHGAGYEFEVEITCKDCSRKRTLRNFTQSLSGATKVEVTPGGVGFK
jgi:hypothetical protein